MTDHARLSASGSHIWMKCLRSPILSKGIARRPSKWADEGTKAHRVAETMLFDRGIRSVGQLDFFGDEAREDMERYVGVYVDYVENLAKQAQHYGVEQKVNLDAMWESCDDIEEMFGTCDFLALTPDNTLHVVDLKYGAGVSVEPKDNTQLLYYAFAAMLTFPGFSTAEKVEMTIIQPRAAHPAGSIRTWKLPTIDVLQWGYDVLQQTAAKILFAEREGDVESLPLVEGDHCRWCAANNGSACPLKRKEKDDRAKKIFNPVAIADPKRPNSEN